MLQGIDQRKAYGLIFLIMSGLLFAYVLSKAIMLSITHDECLTLTIVQGDTWRGGTANNHLLNTWLLFGITPLIGTSEIALRAPNVLAFILFAWFSRRLLDFSPSYHLRFLGLALLLLNPYLLDFFSLARGYGLSLGLMMPAIFFAFEGNESPRSFIRRFQLSMLFIILALLANLNILNISLAIVLLYLAELLIMQREGRTLPAGRQLWHLIVPLLIYAGVLISLYFRISNLAKRNELYFGGENGFFSDTLSLLAQDWTYNGNYGSLWLVLRALIPLVFILASGLAIYRRKFSKLAKIILLLGLSVFGNLLQFWFMGSLLPIHRTALQFFPLIALLIFYFLEELNDTFRYLKGGNYALAGFSYATIAILILHSISSMNMGKVNEWYYEANTRKVMQWFREYGNESGFTAPDISHQWSLEPSLNYYRKRYGLLDMKPFSRDGIRIGSDFIYCSLENSAEAINSGLYTVVMEDALSQTILLKKKEMP